MGSFGAPIPGGGGSPEHTTQQGTEHVNGQSAPGTAIEEQVDPNDPRLVSEILDADTTKDAYATPPLPPDGKWRAKLKLEGVKDATDQVLPFAAAYTKERLPYFRTGVSASIIDPSGKFDGFVVRPEFGGYVSTVLRKDKSSTLTTLLTKIRKPDGAFWATSATRLDQKSWIDLLVRALTGEPEVGIETQWQWNCQKCSEEAKAAGKSYPVGLNGMQRFDAEKDPEKRKQGLLYNPEYQCKVNPGHGVYRAYPKIVRFLTLAEIGIK
jgi:hypothetical protein